MQNQKRLLTASTALSPFIPSPTGRRSSFDPQRSLIHNHICFNEPEGLGDIPPADTPPSDDKGTATGDDKPADGDKGKGDDKDTKGGKERLYGDDKDDKDTKEGDDKSKDKDTKDDKPKKDDKPDTGEYKPEDYKLEIPESLGLKDEKGEPLKFVEGDPLVVKAQALFAENKIDPKNAGKFMELYGEVIKDTRAGAEAIQSEQTKAHETKMLAELAKLEIKGEDGKTTSGAVRIENLNNSLDDVLGDGASKTFAPGLQNSDIVIALETLIGKATGGTMAKDGETKTTGKSATERFYGKKKR